MIPIWYQYVLIVWVCWLKFEFSTVGHMQNLVRIDVSMAFPIRQKLCVGTERLCGSKGSAVASGPNCGQRLTAEWLVRSWVLSQSLTVAMHGGHGITTLSGSKWQRKDALAMDRGGERRQNGWQQNSTKIHHVGSVEFYKYPMLSYVIPICSVHQTKGRWFLISSGDQGRLRWSHGKARHRELRKGGPKLLG